MLVATAGEPDTRFAGVTLPTAGADAIDTTGVAAEALPAVQKTAAENVKRVVHFDGKGIGWDDGRRSQGPYAIFDFQESKTVWHPIGF